MAGVKGMAPELAVAASSVAPRAGPTLKSLDPTEGPVGTEVKIKGKNFGTSGERTRSPSTDGGDPLRQLGEQADRCGGTGGSDDRRGGGDDRVQVTDGSSSR